MSRTIVLPSGITTFSFVPGTFPEGQEFGLDQFVCAKIPNVRRLKNSERVKLRRLKLLVMILRF